MDLFNKLGKKATETFQNTKEKTAKITEEYKIKATLADDKLKISELLNEIGKIVYEARENHQDIDENIIEEKCEQIDKIKREMKDLEEKILELKDILICSGCGNKVSANDKFCSVCGEKVEKKYTNVEVNNTPSKDAIETEVTEVRDSAE